MTTRRRVLVAMSGGVDSSVAAACLLDAGHEVVGVTMRLWGGDTDSGCCSVSDVDDARRVAQQLGIDHHVFNFTDDFTDHVVAPYVAAHARGLTPNPCIECNASIKFTRLTERARLLGFDAVATGHHARIMGEGVRRRVARGRDAAKDQSYVLWMLDGEALERIELPVGAMTKDEVRARARALGLRTAAKPDSQDVCFITATDGRARFLARRTELRPGRVVDSVTGRQLGEVPAVQLVTVGQRRGLGLAGGPPRYVRAVDVEAGVVTVGEAHDLLVAEQPVVGLRWAGDPTWGPVQVQVSAHGPAEDAELVPAASGGDDVPAAAGALVRWHLAQRRVAPGQSVVFYHDDRVEGGGTAASAPA